MNKNRKNEVLDIIKNLNVIKNNLQNVLNNEEMAYDCMPENLHYSIKGEESEECIEYMNEAIECLDNAIEQLEMI